MMKSIVTTMIGAAAVLAMAGCAQPTAGDIAAEAPSTVESVSLDPEFEAAVNEFAELACEIFDTYGPEEGSLLILDTGLDHGFTGEELGIMVTYAAMYECPRYLPILESLAEEYAG